MNTQSADHIENEATIWTNYANRITWVEPWKKLKEISFRKPVSIKWYLGGKLNVSYNCIDRHLPKHGDKTAFIFEPDQPGETALQITYKELYHHVCRFANLFKKYGVKKGDRVTIYMPMIPEAAYAMLACTRIGAVHSVVFGGFSAESLAGRIHDCESDFIVTANVGLRGGKEIPLKKNVDDAVLLAEKLGHKIRHTLVVERTSAVWDKKPIDISYQAESKNLANTCDYEIMDSEDPLFILYTSGSTGKPKGVLHTTGGYLTYASATHESVFNYKPGDIYWCTADVGWITGHSYIVYGPLSNAATSLIFEGVPNYPTPSRFWQVIDKHQVNIFYTAPTAVRALMREDLKYVNEAKLSSLKLLGSVGEPINPEAWNWYHKNIGKNKCPIVDTWWQTETGGILISPLAQSERIQTQQKPGSATQPLPGIKTEVLDPQGNILSGACEGLLVIKDSWPGQMRTVYKDHQRFEETYFSTFAGYYFTGDGCRRDEGGDYWITGRVDDVINVSGHRIGTAEVESALVANLSVAEAAVVGFPHDLKGQGIYAYVTLKNGIAATDQLKLELIQEVRKHIGPIASPDKIQWAPGLPKTRSGKIMRRILRKIAENQLDQLGDISTLADPSVVEQLKANRIYL